MSDNQIENNIISELNRQVNYFIKSNKYQDDIRNTKFSSIRTINKTEIWSEWSHNILQDMNNNIDVLKSFRKNNYFITDVPGDMHGLKKIFYNFFSIMPYKLKKYHPKICMLEDFFDFLKSKNLLSLLARNPSPKIGNPELYIKENMIFTHRWIRHIWLLNLYNKFLNNKNVQVIMDIGSNFGALAYLLKKNNPKLKFILVDFPEALSTAHYFIKKEFSTANIASFDDLKDLKKIDESIIKKNDFILLPCFWIEKLEKNTVDLTINIASFNEMNRFWFSKYTNSEVYQSSKFIFLMNRFRRPAIEENEKPIDILDLKLDKFKKIHFDISELYKWDYTHRSYLLGLPVFFKKNVHPPVYEFIGERKYD